MHNSGAARREIAKLFPTRHRPRRRAIQYSRDADDGIEKPRRTGYPACAGYDGVVRRGTVAVIARSGATKQSIFFLCAARWIASRSLSSGAHSRDPLARNDGSTVGCLKIESRTCNGGGELPLPLWERVGVRGSGLSIVRNPSPGSQLSMRSDLSHKGRGDTKPAEPAT